MTEYSTCWKCCINKYVSNTIKLIERFILVLVKIDYDY